MLDSMLSSSTPAVGGSTATAAHVNVQHSVPAKSTAQNSTAQRPGAQSPQQQQLQNKLVAAQQRLKALNRASKIAHGEEVADMASSYLLVDKPLLEQAQQIAAGPRHTLPDLYAGLFTAAVVLMYLQARILQPKSLLVWLVGIGKLLLLHLSLLEHSRVVARCSWVIRFSWLLLRRDAQRWLVLHLREAGREQTQKATNAMIEQQLQGVLYVLQSVFGQPGPIAVLGACVVCMILGLCGKLAVPGRLTRIFVTPCSVVDAAYLTYCCCKLFHEGGWDAVTLPARQVCARAVQLFVFFLLLLVEAAWDLGTVVVKTACAATATVFTLLSEAVCTGLPWLFTLGLRLVVWCRHAANFVCRTCFVQAARAVLWLRASMPYARRAWVRVCKVLWLLVAADMVSLPWQHVMLDSYDTSYEPRGLALLLPLVQILAVHMLLMLNRPAPKGAAKRALQAWVDIVSRVQHCLAAVLAVNWFCLAAAAIVSLSDNIFQASTVTVGGEVHLGGVRAHLVGHFVATGVYTLLSAAVAVVVSSKAAQAQLQCSVAFLHWLPFAVVSRLRSAGMLCMHAVCTAARVAVGRPYAALVCCKHWLVSSSNRCKSISTALVVHLPAQLLARMLAGLRCMHTACSKGVCAALAHTSAAPAAVLRAWTCAVQAALAAAATAAHWGRAAEGIQHGAVEEDAPQQTAEAEAVESAAQTVSTEVPLVEVPDVATRTAVPAKKHTKKMRASCMVHDCVVCLDAPRSVALFPCRHIALCDHCFADLQRQAQRMSAQMPCLAVPCAGHRCSTMRVGSFWLRMQLTVSESLLSKGCSVFVRSWDKLCSML